MSSTHIPATRNEAWGFWGTMNEHATGEDAGNVRAFLDSRYGRHYTDEVHNGLYVGKTLKDAIGAATQ